MCLTRHRLGYFRTATSRLGGGFRPPVISRTKGRKAMGEAALERSHGDVSLPSPRLEGGGGGGQKVSVVFLNSS